MRVQSVLVLSGLVVMMSSGCEGAPAPGEQGAAAQAPTVKPAAEPAVEPAAAAPAKLTEEQARLKALPWEGDASAAQATAFQGRYSQSGSWGEEAAGRREFLAANYTMRANRAPGELAFVVVDATPEGPRLKLFKGTTFTPADVTLEVPVSGAVDRMGADAAHGKIAVLGWDEAQPRLTVYQQSDKAKLWSASLDIKSWEAPMVVAWQPSGHVAVEWRGGEGRYERVFFDGATGAERLRERLDPRVEAVLKNPVAWIMEAPHDERSDPGDMAGLTRAQQWVRQPPRALGLACAVQERESVRRRVVELDEGILLIAAMPYMNHDGRPRSPSMESAELGKPPKSARPAAPVVMSARCSSVTLYDAERIRSIGSWAKIKP